MKYCFSHLAILLLLILLLCPFAVKAVNQDSLFQAIEAVPADTHQVNLLNDFGRKHKVSNPELAVSYFKKGIEIGTKIGFDAGTGRSWLYICQSQTATGDYENALAACEKAEALFERAREVSYVGKTWNSVGVIHLYRGELDEASRAYVKALEHFSEPFNIATLNHNLANVRKMAGDEVGFVEYQLKALDGFTELEDRGMMLYCLGNLSVFYIQRGDLEKAREYNEQSYAVLDGEGTAEELVFIDAQKANILTQSGDSTSGMELFRQVRAMNAELGHVREEATALSNIAGIYFGWGEYELAEERWKEAGKIFREVEDLRGQASTEANLAQILLATGKQDSGLAKLEHGLAFALELGEATVLTSIYDQLATAYAAAGDSSNALRYREKYMETQAELRDPVEWRKVVEMEGDFQSKEQQAEMDRLSTEQTKMGRIISLLIIGLVIAVAILLIMLFFLRKRSRNQQPAPEEIAARTVEATLAQAEARGRIKELRTLLEEKERTIRELQARPQEAPAQKMLPPYFETLSAREIEVFLCLGEGMTDKEIAEDLSISLATVRTHARNVYSKLNLKNRAAAVKMAHQYHLLSR